MRKYKNKYLVAGLLFIHLTLFSSPNTIINKVTAVSFATEPKVEELDLSVNGSGAGGVFVNASIEFDFVIRAIWNLDFTINALDIDNFAGEASPLTNGIDVYYNDVKITPSPIDSLKAFDDTSYDTNILSDDKNPIGHALSSRWTFAKFDPDGLFITSGRQLAFHIQDDITALTSVSRLIVTLEGYERSDSNVIEEPDLYYPGIINTITINNLVVGIDYKLYINTSQVGIIDRWSNFTAEETTVEIDTYFLDLSQDDKYISFYLYEDSDFLDQMSVLIQIQSFTFLDTLLFRVLPIIIMLVIIIVVVLHLISEGKDTIRLPFKLK